MAIKRMGVVGSGIMGSGVAEVAAKAGFEVVLRSRAQDSADAMVAGLEKSLAKQVDKGRLEEAERDAIVGRVRAVTDLDELADCDLVLESIVEELAPKLELFTELDKICGENAILASNTSTLSIGARRQHRTARQGLRHPLLQPGDRDDPRRDRPSREDL